MLFLVQHLVRQSPLDTVSQSPLRLFQHNLAVHEISRIPDDLVHGVLQRRPVAALVQRQLADTERPPCGIVLGGGDGIRPTRDDPGAFAVLIHLNVVLSHLGFSFLIMVDLSSMNRTNAPSAADRLYQ